MRVISSVLFSVLLIVAGQIACAEGFGRADGDVSVAPAEPTPALAQQLFELDAPPQLSRIGDAAPGWQVNADGVRLGVIASTWEIARSVGYSGQPLDVLVAVDAKGVIIGAELMRHNEPILTLGLTDADIARFVGGFAGIDLAAPEGPGSGPDMPDIISRATVSTGVIRDSILRTARTVAIGHGLIAGGGIDRIGYEPLDWSLLRAQGAITTAAVSLSEARERMPDAKVPVPEGDALFVEIFAALVDPPSIGRNLLGQSQFNRAVGALGPGETALFIGSRGLFSHRGTEWRKSGVFDRLAVVQDDARIPLVKSGYTRVDDLAAPGAPDLKERSLFTLPAEGFDPTRPFSIELVASRPAEDGGETGFTLALPYELPSAYITAPPQDFAPLWQETWQKKRYAVISVMVMMAALTALLLIQEWLVRRPRVWLGLRMSFLSLTLVWLGWILNGQLSVVQVVAFVHALLTGFRWETFLIEPVIFTLWTGVALGLLFWGRGVFCGWLCPFGALQELTNAAARRLGVPQVPVAHAIHERLWILKYTLFVAILAVSFYSMEYALILAEAEPFKTAISMQMMRAWPFVAFVIVLLAAGLFIERFYCRYLCPLGAGLAIPAKLKIFDWLHRRPQCGRECRLCETKCTVGAIDPLGRINPNECVLCLRCQVVMNDKNTCPVLKRRQRQAASA